MYLWVVRKGCFCVTCAPPFLSSTSKSFGLNQYYEYVKLRCILKLPYFEVEKKLKSQINQITQSISHAALKENNIKHLKNVMEII